MTKTIALVVPSLENTGGVTAVAEFVMRTILDHSDYRLKLISLATAARDKDSLLLTAPHTWWRGATTSEAVFRGTPYTHVGARFSEIETQRLKPREVLTRELDGCDLVQVVCGSPSYAGPVLGLGIPVCVQAATLIAVEREARNAQLKGLPGVWKRAMTRQVTALETPALQKADSVQVENHWMYEHVCRVTESSGTEVLIGAPGVDDSLFHPATERPSAPGYLLAVGRMSDPRKNHMLLLETYRLLHQQMPNPPRLVLAGSSGPTEAFRGRVQELDLQDWVDVHFLPSKEDLAALYRGARAFALTSDEEGFGVTLIEAMASGAPPVSTRSGGPDGIVTHGEDGYLVDCGDAAGLAMHLVDLLSDDELNSIVSAKARRTAEARFGAKTAGQVFLDVYERLLSD